MNPVVISPLFLTQVTQLVSESEQGLASVANLLNIGIGVFSLLLLALSISAYRRTGMQRLIYAAIAFGLFAVQLFLEYVEDTIASIEPYDEVIFPGITFAILVLFFLAIVSRK